MAIHQLTLIVMDNAYAICRLDNKRRLKSCRSAVRWARESTHGTAVFRTLPTYFLGRSWLNGPSPPFQGSAQHEG
jgi:hypothetical protein